ncbi:hypothetical protein [Profundibacterium mesophilum]|uniref:Uncharacterized protein n=1 Tax=Profundibacterium mesophilum KAUST100406-0324 TaxID=1037889 RepID=A0A921TEN2_9RHOB|nr:hypothetical protein [Profundibacterium mesophilum]KAF0677476.1 hypothetical protein PMES_00169 [Profundibacterium mesophilum KAUST100406-0324]
MNPAWLLRMVRWARRPPSRKRVALMLAVAAIALAIAGLEAAGLWPEWATLDRGISRRGP